MSDTATLIDLATQVRRDTIRMLKTAPADSITWTPPGTANHVLWHAGHALWLEDHFAIKPVTGQSELPAGWYDLFASGSEPAKITAWPEQEAIVEALQAQHRRAVQLLEAAGEGHGPTRLNDAERWQTFASSLIHGLHDEARHQGEMYLLLKMLRARGDQPDR
jgi:hypothetical protein